MHMQINDDLRVAYDQSVDEREANFTQAWKVSVRDQFLGLLRQEGKLALLEVGAGTGVHGRYFLESGLEVLCTDLSMEMVASCRSKGLRAEQADFMSISRMSGFEAIFSMNCFLHVPPDSLQEVLLSMHNALVEGGLLYWGQYGGVSFEGTMENDTYEPKRYFSMLTDSEFKDVGSELFELIEFDSIEVDPSWEQHFQSSVWRKRDA